MSKVVQLSNGPVFKWHLNTGQKKSGIQMFMQPKQPYVVRSLPFEYRTICIPDNHSVQYSDESGIRVSGIQMVTVCPLFERSVFG